MASINIENFVDEEKVKRCLTQVTIGDDSRFYPEAKVFNYSDILSKIQIGTHTHIRGELVVFPSGGVIKIGNDCFIGERSKIWSQSSVLIGNNVLISHDVNIHDTNSHPLNNIERREDYRQIISSGFSKTNTNVITKAVKIDDDVWIGFNSIIMKGVHIGKGSIVAAGSVVTSNIPEFTLVAGNPAKPIKSLKENEEYL
ncbi:acyltransferase [Pedobacter arcticus]|uniref:acyltransferase n=1 Tax=Pedobacter arcticus TaxID=752140 RepID=UPI0002EA1020|nr:acyltransferase [Pedobacter arcticus]